MLVLSRKVDEDIRIGDQIIVRVLGVKDGQVKLGIEAPRSVRVFRGELYVQAQKENLAAASADRSSAKAVAASLTHLGGGDTGTSK
ncbi:MAG TPA: carbon storage regulator CsrA [Bacteroidota bacterium]|nr:carbon storage regulator CsrA [Bacteroidota bacterium]